MGYKRKNVLIETGRFSISFGLSYTFILIYLWQGEMALLWLLVSLTLDRVQLMPKFKTVMTFWWITYSSDPKRNWIANLLHTRFIIKTNRKSTWLYFHSESYSCSFSIYTQVRDYDGMFPKILIDHILQWPQEVLNWKLIICNAVT